MTTSSGTLAAATEQRQPSQHRAPARAPSAACCNGLICHFLLALDSASVHLIAPKGALGRAAVLPASEPAGATVVGGGGNVAPGLVGMACVKWPGSGVGVAALVARSGHQRHVCPALLASSRRRRRSSPWLGGASVHAAGFEFVFITVLFNSAVLVACAVLYNNLTGRRYPHIQQLVAPHPHATRDDAQQPPGLFAGRSRCRLAPAQRSARHQPRRFASHLPANGNARLPAPLRRRHLRRHHVEATCSAWNLGHAARCCSAHWRTSTTWAPCPC